MSDINEWWTAGQVRAAFIEPVERQVTARIMETMDERQILLLEGPRRVGKTSIMFHLIKRLIDRGIEPKRIIYLSLDDPLIGKENFFEGLTDIIEKHLGSLRLQAESGRYYLFLDEVTSLPDWELYLKRYYDRKYPFKFIVSSSAASFLVKTGRESLAGRVFRFSVAPFSFSEFLRLKTSGSSIEEREKIQALWDDFWRTLNSQTLFSGLAGISEDAVFRQRDMELNLHSYLMSGGFPEFLQLTGDRAILRYFSENVIERVVYHDIPEAFAVSDRGLLENLLLYSIFHSGSIININEMAASFKAARQTVSDYLHYLQASMLVRLLKKYARTEASRLRAFRKVYTVDTGLYIHLQRLTPAQIEQRGAMGQLAEIAVFSQLASFPDIAGRLSYYREREAEVDFVAETLKGPVPVEVKYRQTPDGLKGLAQFKERFNVSAAVVITKNMLKLDAGVLYVPLGLFLA